MYVFLPGPRIQLQIFHCMISRSSPALTPVSAKSVDQGTLIIRANRQFSVKPILFVDAEFRFLVTTRAFCETFFLGIKISNGCEVAELELVSSRRVSCSTSTPRFTSSTVAVRRLSLPKHLEKFCIHERETRTPRIQDVLPTSDRNLILSAFASTTCPRISDSWLSCRGDGTSGSAVGIASCLGGSSGAGTAMSVSTSKFHATCLARLATAPLYSRWFSVDRSALKQPKLRTHQVFT